MKHGNDKEDIKTVLEDVEQRTGIEYRRWNYTWWAFPQTWGSTALGFGGIGGSAMTTAQTYVVTVQGRVLVYFGSRFAYEIKDTLRWKLEEYLNKRFFPAVKDFEKVQKELQADEQTNS